MPAWSSSEGPTWRRTNSSKGSSASVGVSACCSLTGDLLTCPTHHVGLVGRPPRSVTGPESLTVTCTASTFGADVGRLLSRVASPERYVGLRVSRGELLLRRPL